MGFVNMVWTVPIFRFWQKYTGGGYQPPPVGWYIYITRLELDHFLHHTFCLVYLDDHPVGALGQ
jgi:hypothetical protein